MSAYSLGLQALERKQLEGAKLLFQAVLELESPRDEKYLSCLKLAEVTAQNKEQWEYWLRESHKYDNQRVEGLYSLIHYHTCLSNPIKAFEYYEKIQNYYENNYLSDNQIEHRLEFNKSIYDLYLPYYMILVCDRLVKRDCGVKMFEIIFQKQYMSVPMFYISNLFYNLNFFLKNAIDSWSDIFIENVFQYFNKIEKCEIEKNRGMYYNILNKLNPVRTDEVFGIKQVCFTKEECKLSKNILIYVGFYKHPWNYTTFLKEGQGGCQICAIQVAKGFRQDYTVYVCGNVKEEVVGNVHYVDLAKLELLTKTKAFHTVILSRYINALEDFKISTYKLHIWQHDYSLIDFSYIREKPAIQYLEHSFNRIDSLITLTEWHKHNTIIHYPLMKDKIRIIPNGVDCSIFPKQCMKVKNRFVFTSCPNRGYTKLFKLWSQILKILPDAQLKLATYSVWPTNAEEELQKKFVDENPSIEFLGRLNSEALHALTSTAEYWYYPSVMPETFCITALEMLYSEVICFYNPIGGLLNVLGDYGFHMNN